MGKFIKTKLADICTFENGDRGKNYPSRSAYTKEGIPFFSAGNIFNNKINENSLNYISKERFEQLGRGKVRKNDFLFCLRGSLGKFAIIDKDIEGGIASSLVIIRPSEKIDIGYLSYFLESHLCLEMINQYDNGTAQPNLSAANLKKFIIPLPPLPEQQRIMAKLDALFAKIDRAIGLLEENIAHTQALMGSVLDEEFGRLKKNYEEVALSKLIKIRSGKFLSSKKMSNSGEYNVYGGNGITGTHRESNLKGKNIIIGRVGAKCGNVRLVEGDIWVTDNAFYISEIKKDIDKEFLTESLQILNLGDTANKAAQPVISFKGIKNLAIPIPSKESQNSFCTKIKAFRQKSYSVEKIQNRKIEYLKSLKSSLLDQAFRGEL